MLRRLTKSFAFRTGASAALEVGGCVIERGSQPLAKENVTQMLLDKGLHGNGRPVLLVPGMLAGEWHMGLLKEFLEGLGHTVYHWEQGTNTGLKRSTHSRLESRIEQISALHGGAKVALVGESIGGLKTQELERKRPDLVRMSISLGTPRSGINREGRISRIARAFYAAMNPWSWSCLTDEDAARRFGTPPDNGVPKTAIMSRFDQIVDFRTTVMPEAFPKVENVEVLSTHIGMVYNIFAQTVVADRLAQDPANWKPFDAAEYNKLFSFFIKHVPANDIPASPGWNGAPDSDLNFDNNGQHGRKPGVLGSLVGTGKRVIKALAA